MPKKKPAVDDKVQAAAEWLEDHARQCVATVEGWMLRTLPVPRAVLEAVIPDRRWAAALKDAWIVPVGKDGTADRASGGFFRGVDAGKGIGVVDRDGETAWLKDAAVVVPHPVLLDEVDDLRQMAVELGVSQGISQLFREVFAHAVRPGEVAMTAVTAYAGGKFDLGSQAIGVAKRNGYRVAGGAAICRVLERGGFVEARYDLGDGSPEWETVTGELTWVDARQRGLSLAAVPPVAYSEGMRMAAGIYAARKVEGSDDE